MLSVRNQDVSHSFFSAGVVCELAVLIMRGCSLRSLPHASNLSALEGLDLSCNPVDPECEFACFGCLQPSADTRGLISWLSLLMLHHLSYTIEELMAGTSRAPRRQTP